MHLIPLLFKKIIQPPRFKYIKRWSTGNADLMVLDIGCGSRSCELTKQWLQVREYHGVDKEVWQGDEASYLGIDRFFPADLETSNLGGIPDGFYDVLIVSHVIEHLTNALPTLRRLSMKVRSSGVIYIESPTLRTINFPSAIGFLNFYDDPTHKRIYFDSEIVPLLQECGFKVTYAGYRRDWVRVVFLTPLAILLNALFYIPIRRKLCAYGLWDALGVARVWVAIKM